MSLKDTLIGQAIQKVQRAAFNIGQGIRNSLNDNQGWFQQGKFTPQNYLNSTFDNGNNFWGNQGGQTLANVQRATQPTVQPLMNTIGRGFQAMGNLNQYVTPGIKPPTPNYKPWQDIQKTVSGSLATAGLATNPGMALGSGLFNAGVNTVLNTAQRKSLPSNLAQSVGEGLNMGAMISPVLGVTNPLISKLVNPLGGQVASRVGSGIANVGQGLTINASTGTTPTPQSIGIDVLMGLAGGKGQFESPNISKMTNNVNVKEKDFINNVLQRLRVGITPADHEVATKEIKTMAKTYGLDSYPGWKKLSLEKQANLLNDRMNEMTQWAGIKMGIIDPKSSSSLLENKRLLQPVVLTKKQSIQQLPPTTPVSEVSSSQIISSTQKLVDSVKRIKNEKMISVGMAEIAQNARHNFSPAELLDINKLKQMSRSKAFLEGDIETLRKRNGDLVDRVAMSVLSNNPNIKSEADALDFALSMPTKSSTMVKKPILSPNEKQIRFQALKEQQQLEKDFGKSIYGEIGNAKAKQQLKSLGATLTPKQYQSQQFKKIRLQSEGSRKAGNEAINYFNNINIPAYKRGKINLGESLPADELLKVAKDKMAFAYQRETMLRNVEEIFGRDSKMKKFVIGNITDNENKSARFQDTLLGGLKRVFTKNGIGKRSKQDYAAADFIEGNINLKELQQKFPKEWYKIVKVADEGRIVYKNLLTRINEQLTRFGYEAIPEMQDYITHTRKLQRFADKLGSMFNLNSEELPRAMAGINMDTKPGKRFFISGLQRRGGSTHEGLITALEKYIPNASRQIFHTEDIQRGRAILDLLRKSAGEGDTRLSGFTSYFSQYVDYLAGKQNIIDRPIEKVFGRKFLEIGNWTRRRTGANMIGGNISVALTNFIPFTQFVATTNKSSVVKGLLEATTNYGKPAELIDGVQSGFLLRRFYKNNITGTLGENIQEGFSLPFRLVDKFTSTAVVAGKYFEQISRGLSKQKAMAVADDYAQRVMADRSFGQLPLLFNSKILSTLTQFQLEVNNQVSFLLKDIPNNMGYSKAQITSSLIQFAIYSYLFNDIYQRVVGRRPQIDPIYSAMETIKDLQEGQGLQAFNPIDPYTKGISDKTGMGQMLNNLPFTSIGGGRIPTAQALKQPQYYLLPPFGGGQIKKTVEGLRAYNKGYSESAGRNVQYPIEQNTTNAIKTAILGRYSVPEAGKYFASNEKTLSPSQTEKFKQASDRLKVYRDIINDRQLNRDINDVIATMQTELSKKGSVKPEQIGNVYLIPQDGTISKIELKQFSLPKKTGNIAKDKKAISGFKSSITTQLKQVDRLITAGAMPTVQGEELKKNLESLRNETTTKLKIKTSKKLKVKKTKKIKIPKLNKIKIKTTKIKFTKPKKFKAIKLKKPKKLKVKRIAIKRRV